MGLRHYIAMEFVDGPSLGHVIRQEHALPLKEALRIFGGSIKTVRRENG
jgi:hypothetical protein